MKNSKKILVITLSLFLVSILSMIGYKNLVTKPLIISNSVKPKNDALAILIETQVGSGKYTTYDKNSWPEGKYKLNKTLSKCENGGNLEFDETNKKMLVSATKSDRCYIYFDKSADVLITTENMSTAGVQDATINCQNGSATFNKKYNQLQIQKLSDDASCQVRYPSQDNTNYLTDYLENLADRDLGMFHERIGTLKENPSYTEVDMNYSNISGISMVKSGTRFTTNESSTRSKSEHLFTFKTSGMYQICYSMPASTTTTSNNLTVYKVGQSNTLNTVGSNTNSGETKSACIDLKKPISIGNTIKITTNSNNQNITVWFNKTNDYSSKDYGYRYQGPMVNNYIWFNNELWRIVGVFDYKIHGQNGMDLVKIVRDKELLFGKLRDYKADNWVGSNTYNILNDNYYNKTDVDNGLSYMRFSVNGIGSTYRNMVKKVGWTTAKTMNENSVIENFNIETSAEKAEYYIGTLTPSDFSFSSIGDKDTNSRWTWNLAGGWMYRGHESFANNFFTYIGTNILNLSSTSASGGESSTLRPAVFLREDVYLISGTGTQSDPYLVGVD